MCNNKYSNRLYATIILHITITFTKCIQIANYLDLSYEQNFDNNNCLNWIELENLKMQLIDYNLI